MEHLSIGILGFMGLLALAVLILPAARRLNISHTVLLALVGFGLGGAELFLDQLSGLGILYDFLVGLKGFSITSDIVLFLFLPALIFESALSIEVNRLMDDIGPILLLAVVGLLISTFVVGYSMWAFSGMGLVVCMLLGAIVSATDPVAVVAIFKDLKVPKRLAILVEGESLFNDATAIVMFSILAAMLAGQTDATLLAGAWLFLKVFAGGVITGYVCARVVCAFFKAIGVVPIVKITLTLCLAYLSFIFAEHYLHVSGVMATVTSALVMGSVGRSVIAPNTWKVMEKTWDHIGFWANSIIFLLVGMMVPKIVLDMSEKDAGLLLIMILTAFAARGAIIFGLLPLFTFRNLIAKVSLAFKTVMFWGGLRGAVSLALALALMENPAYDEEVRRFIGLMVTGLVLFTLFVNATTIGAVLRFFGLQELSPADLTIRNRAMEISISDICKSVEEAARDMQIDPKLSTMVINKYRNRFEELKLKGKKIEGIADDEWLKIGLTGLAHQEREEYLKIFGDGFVGSNIVRDLLSRVEDIIDGIRAEGGEGYSKAWRKGLDFDWQYRLALRLHRMFNYSSLLSRLLADRFEILLSQQTTIRDLLSKGIPQVAQLMGDELGGRLKESVEERFKATDHALTMLKLQYPEFAALLEERYLSQVAHRLEEADFREMLDHSVISEEVFNNLQAEIEATSNNMNKRFRLDLGLEPEKLVARVPFFKDLSEERIVEIAKLLKSRLVLPKEKILREGDVGKAMYFISTGSVEVEVEPEPVQLGSNDFFGEIALVKEIPRTADVVAHGFCELLVLYAKDFHALLDSQPELRDVIQRVAQDRMK